MKILMIAKYPPIQGGVSSKNYWLAKALGEKGHEVFVATNSWEVEPQHRIQIQKEDLSKLEPKNVQLFSTNKDFLPPIPRSRYYESRLSTLSIDIARRHNIDVIYSHYLLPYGISALMTKKITDRPLVVRHAGSDITRLYSYPQLKTIFNEVLNNADVIIEYSNTRKILRENNINPGKLIPIPQGINLEEFSPETEQIDLSSLLNKEINEDAAVFSYFGKISKLKKTYEFANVASRIKDKNFIILFVTGSGRIVEELKEHIRKLNLEDKCFFLPFQPPWNIPKIMKASTCIVSPESYEAPFFPTGTHGPQIAQEAMACGKCAIIGKGVAEKGFYKELKNRENILIVNPEDEKDFMEKLNFIIENKEEAGKIGMNGRKFMEKNNRFDLYISSMINIFKSL